MAWDFETEPEFEKKLDWIREFVKDCIEPLDLMYPHRAYYPLDDEMHRYIDPMREEIRKQELWAPHLGPELDQIMNEVEGEAVIIVDDEDHGGALTVLRRRGKG